VSVGQLLNDLAIDLSLSIHEVNEISLSHRHLIGIEANKGSFRQMPR
jgi:hypothetical protein